jgi:glycine cleavage system H protein
LSPGRFTRDPSPHREKETLLPSPGDLRYTKEHEWVRLESDIGTVGITDYAQDQLGDIVFVDLPATGTAVSHMQKFGEIESVKAVSELYSPVTGEVVEANAALASSPELVNDSPYGEGWMLRVRLSDPAEVEKLLSAEEYDDFIAQGAE